MQVRKLRAALTLRNLLTLPLRTVTAIPRLIRGLFRWLRRSKRGDDSKWAYRVDDGAEGADGKAGEKAEVADQQP